MKDHPTNFTMTPSSQPPNREAMANVCTVLFDAVMKSIVISALLLGGCASVPKTKVAIQATAVPITLLTPSHNRSFRAVSLYARGVPIPKWYAPVGRGYVLVDQNLRPYEAGIFANRRLVVNGEAMMCFPHDKDGATLAPEQWNIKKDVFVLKARRSAIRILP